MINEKEGEHMKSVRVRSLVLKVITYCISLLAFMGTTYAASWYISPTGDDTSAGTYEAPFKSLMKAQDAASEGDTVYILGGTYKDFEIANESSVYHYVNEFTKSGITYAGYSTEDVPVFDFSSIPTDKRVSAFRVTSGASNVTFYNMKVTGVKVGTQKQSECFRIEGKNINFNRVTCYDAEAIGFYYTGHSTGLCVNCDAYNLYATGESSIGNMDGFGAHGDGVTFIGCRAWRCSDDGYDAISSKASDTFIRCWAYDMTLGGDSNGFKIGDGTPPDPMPTHTVKYCLAAECDSSGFYANHMPGKAADWLFNTAFNNKRADFNMLERTSLTDDTDIPGTRQYLLGNISYSNHILNIAPESTVIDCSWNGDYTVTEDDFISLDASEMTKPRGKNGELPEISFMHLAKDSDLKGLGCFN